MRLDIEKENMKSLTSPIKKPTTTATMSTSTTTATTPTAAYKQISPDDRVAMNVLDGTSPNKAKRFRPKTRR